MTKRAQGFTLLEVLMILTVIVMSGMIIIPPLTKFMTSWDLESEGRKLMARLTERQQKTVGQVREEYGLSFTESDPSCYSVGGYYMMGWNLEEVECLGKGVTASVPVNSETIYFDRLGTPQTNPQSATFPYVIVLQDAQGKQLHLEVDGVTGRMRLTYP